MSNEAIAAPAAATGGLSSLIGEMVELTSLEGQDRFVDIGTLESYSHPWVQIKKKSGDSLFFPVYNIRLIKASK